MTKRDDIETLFALSLIKDGKMAANEIYLSSLATVLVEQFPNLLPLLKESFNGVVDLHKTLRKSQGAHEYEMNAFENEVQRLNSYFKLMKGGGFFDGDDAT